MKIILSDFETALPYSTSQAEVVESTRAAGMGDGFCCWLDHLRGDLDVPEPLDHESCIATFWPNNPYNERRAKQRGMTVEAFVELRFAQICDLRDRLGERFSWCIGWETFMSDHWLDEHGNKPVFATLREGFEFHRRWLSTSLHNKHWRRCEKFGEARFNTRPSVCELLSAKGLDPADFNLIAGDFIPSRAHHTFDALPFIKGFWWECGHNATGLQADIPFMRGAARQYGKQWIMDVSPYSYPFPIHDVDAFYEDMGEWASFEHGAGGKARLNFPKYTADGVRLGGYSVELLLRCWITSLMAGCDVLFQEASCLSHFVKKGNQLALTPMGEAARRLGQFHRDFPDVGTPVAPVALVLDRWHGVDPHHAAGRPWHYMEATPGSRQIPAFFSVAYPGHSQWPSFPADQYEYGRMLREKFDFRPNERKLLVPGRWADCFDVLCGNAGDEAFEGKPILLLLGDHEPERLNATVLRERVAAGSTLICAPGTAASAGFPEYAEQADPEWRDAECDGAALPGVITRNLGKGCVFVCSREDGFEPDRPLVKLLDRLIADSLPCALEGPPAQWVVNKTGDGYLMLVVNHGADAWRGTAILKEGTATRALDLWSGAALPVSHENGAMRVTLTIPPYGFCIVRFI